MSEDAVWDTEKGELRILGHRRMAIDAQSLCDHLDSLVGTQVGEVIMHNIEFRLGKLDAARLKSARPRVPPSQLVEDLTESDRLSGIGITKVKLSENPGDSMGIEVTNPCVVGVAGAGKTFVLSWWAGAFTSLFDKEFDVKNVTYDKQKNMLKGHISARQ